MRSWKVTPWFSSDLKNEISDVINTNSQIHISNLIVFILVVICAVILITVIIARSIVKPLRKTFMLEKVTEQFKDGIAVTGLDGKINFDGKNLKDASVEVSIDVASIDTDNEKRDGHLRTSDFFMADSFPKITFKSKRVVPGENDKFEIIGDQCARMVMNKF